MTKGPIILHQFARRFGVANPSPFCVKLEMFLRMTDIPYKVRETAMPMRAPKGKIPWIEDGAERIGDSALIIEYLKRTRGVDPDAGLDAEACARDVALTALLEDRLYWQEVHARWLGPGWPVVSETFFGNIPRPFRGIAKAVVQRTVRRQLHAQGTGRHTPTEIQAMAMRDLDAAVQLIGNGPYVHGNTPTSIDAIAYGFIVNLVSTGLPTPLSERAKESAPLRDYVERITARYFSDI